MSFTASTTNAGINPIYQWQVNGVNTGGNARTFISTTLSDGDTVRCRLTSNANCLATPDAISTGLRAKVYPIPQINAGADDTVLTGGQVRLQPSSPDAGLNYRWSPATYLSSDTGASPLCKPTQDIQYTLTVTNEGGCTASDKVAVKVRTILVPSAFSPNGDGINDTWRIQALYSYPGATVEIFDRRGRLLFRSVNNKEWDGLMQGNPLPAGTYYFVIDTKLKGQHPVTGWVQLVK
jgi:gliding motility-associated-like protein